MVYSPWAGWALEQPGTAGLFRLSDAALPTAVDQAATPHNGTYTGGCAVKQGVGVAFNDPSTSVKLDGTGYALLPNVPGLHPANTFTFACTVQRTGNPTASTCLWSSGGVGDLYVGFTAADTLRVRSKGTGDIFVTTATFPVGPTVYRIVATKVGAVTHIYVNGVDQAGTTTDLTLVAANTAEQIGADAGPAEFVIGYMANVLVSSSAWTAAQVAADYGILVWQPPVITNSVAMPGPSGGDDGPALQAIVDGAPNGTRFTFWAGAVYNFAGFGIQLNSRTDLEFNGNGCTFQTSGFSSRNSGYMHGFGAGGCQRIRIHHHTFKGGNPFGGTTAAYHVGQENACGVRAEAHPQYFEVDHNTIQDQWGHGLYTGTGGSGPANTPTGVWWHDNVITRCGVMGMNLASAQFAWVEGNTVVEQGIYPIDFEDGIATEVMKNVYVRRNTLTDWGWSGAFTAHAIVGETGVGMVWDDVVVDGNALAGGKRGQGIDGDDSGIISFNGTDTKTNLKLINNTVSFCAASPLWTTAWRVQACPSLTVTGNVQGLQGSTAFLLLTTCPGAVVSGNVNACAPSTPILPGWPRRRRRGFRVAV